MRVLRTFFATLLTVILVIGMVVGAYTVFPLKNVEDIRSISREMGIDRYLVAALIKAESNFDESAISKADAKGLMQLTDETAMFCAEKMGMELGEGDVYNPEINIRLGSFYLKRLLDMFDGNVDSAIAAYNAGEGRVKEWLGNKEYSSNGEELDNIPYGETKRHVKKIAQYQKIYKLLYPEF